MAWNEGITEQRHLKDFPGKAEAAIGLYRIVMYGTAATQVKVVTAGTDYPLGVSGDASENPTKSTYEAGDPVKLYYNGVAYVEMSGTGSKGDRVMGTTAGKGTKHTTEDGVYVFGHATNGWADGDIIPVEIQKYYVGDFVQT